MSYLEKRHVVRIRQFYPERRRDDTEPLLFNKVQQRLDVPGREPELLPAEHLTPLAQQTVVFAGEHDVLDALIGKTGYRVDPNAGKVFVARDPRSGAAFRDPQGNPSNTRVSAVLVAYGVRASRLATSETPLLWHNPWAKNPLDPGLWQGPQVFVDPDAFELTKGSGLDYRDHLRKRLGYRVPLFDD